MAQATLGQSLLDNGGRESLLGALWPLGTLGVAPQQGVL